jgi:hypothetical protein
VTAFTDKFSLTIHKPTVKLITCIFIKRLNLMLTYSEIAAGLADRNLVLVAKNTGLSYHTVRRVATKQAGPLVSHRSLVLLSDYLLNNLWDTDAEPTL